MQFTKRCSKCGETKPLDLFNQNSKSKDGRTSHCKVCKSKARVDNAESIAAQKRAYYEKNKEDILLAQKQARDNDPEKYKAKEAAKYVKNADKIKARVLGYQKRNPDVYRRAGSKYRANNPHLGRAKTAKRRAYKLRATPKWADVEFEQFFLSEIYHLAQLRNEAGLECHVDHSVPLISKKVCGLHCQANLQILPARENESKGNKHWPDMW
jgi:hypothetical protein